MLVGCPNPVVEPVVESMDFDLPDRMRNKNLVWQELSLIYAFTNQMFFYSYLSWLLPPEAIFLNCLLFQKWDIYCKISRKRQNLVKKSPPAVMSLYAHALYTHALRARRSGQRGRVRTRNTYPCACALRNEQNKKVTFF